MLYAVIVSSLVTVVYTLIGNMLAVAYTDVLQLFFIALGLVCRTVKKEKKKEKNFFVQCT
jgi:Na+/proline symporter